MKDSAVNSSNNSWRWSIYALILFIAAGALLGRIAHVQADHGRTPFLSANDRSRWSTIRSLVDHGTFILDDVIVKPDGKFNKDWATIDLVRHRGHDGQEHYYSSKPPLLTVLLAGEYWLVKNVTGASLEKKPLYVGRLMIALTNVPLFLVYLALIVLLVENLRRTGFPARQPLPNATGKETRPTEYSDFAKVFVVASAAFGTAVTPFVVSLSNHLPAAVACAATLYLVLQIVQDERPKLGWFIAAGLFAAFMVVCELPALSVFPFVGLALLWKSAGKTFLAFLPAALVIATAAVVTNFLAHGTIKPAYGQRKDGRVLGTTTVPMQAGAINRERLMALKDISGIDLSPQIELYSGGENRFVAWDPQTQERLAVVLDEGSSKETPTWQIRTWGNWYDYPGSYWIGDRRGVDRGEPSRVTYVFQLTFGHHGLFSLTPLWLLTLAGGYFAFRDRGTIAWLAAITAALLLICVAFYVSRPLIDRNYGGVSCTFRWLIWQIPLWLVVMLPAVDRLLARRWGMILCGVLLAASVFSAEYSAANPWTQPWLYDYWEQLGWVEE